MTNISKDFYKKIAIESIGHSKDDKFIINNLKKILQSRKECCKYYIEKLEKLELDEDVIKFVLKSYDWHNEQILTILDIKL